LSVDERQQRIQNQANTLPKPEEKIMQQFLQDVISWLVINSMRVDGVQFNLLCEQSVSNIWRKRAFSNLVAFSKELELTKSADPTVVSKYLTIFRERMDYSIENSVPTHQKYSEKIAALIHEHR
jgi:hypothetical protein